MFHTLMRIGRNILITMLVQRGNAHISREIGSVGERER